MEKRTVLQKIVETCKDHQWCRDCILVGADGMCLMDLNPLHWDWEEIERRVKNLAGKKENV